MYRITACIALLMIGVSASAQDQADDSGTTTRVRENPLSILYARDANGQYVPLLNGVGYEEINRFLIERIARSERAKPSPVTLSNLAITGVLEPTVTRMKATISFQIRPGDRVPDNQDSEPATNDWVRVPLAFHEVSLEASPTFEGDGEFILQKNQSDGFVAWYRGSSTDPLTVTLELSAQTQRLAASSELRLTLPEATQSSFEATVPGQTSLSRVLGGRVSEERADEGALFVKCVGLQSSFQLNWQEGDSGTPKPQVPARLDVEGEIDATFEHIGLISSNVKLQLNSNRAISTFDIRIPASGEIKSLDRPNYVARPRPHPADAAFRHYEITMATASVEQSVELRVELRIESNERGNIETPVNIAAIEVVDTQSQTTVRQYGSVRIFNRQEFRVDWEVSPDITQVNDPQLDTDDDLLAVFKYSRQPCSVNVSASARTPRTSVIPTHVLTVDAGRLYLKSVFRYRVRDGGISELTIKLDDWRHDYTTLPDEIQPKEEYITDGVLSITFETPISNDFEIQMRSHQVVQPPILNLTFPAAAAGGITPATILVGAADNVTLEFPEHRQRGFLQDAIPDELQNELPAMTTTQPVRCFRMQTEQQTSEFFVESTVREQHIHLNVASAILLGSDSVRVRQRFAFDIQYERLERLRFRLPDEVYEMIRTASLNARVKTTINGKDFPASQWIRSFDFLRNTIAAIQLPEAAIGNLVVDIEYALDGDDYTVGESESLDIPLITAELNQSGTVSNQLIVNPDGVRVSGLEPSSPWEPNDQIKANFPITTRTRTSSGDDIGLNAIGAVSAGQPDQLSVLASTVEDAVASSLIQPTRLDRLFVHTTISSSRRRDQVAMLVQPGIPQVVLNLPNDHGPPAMRVWVNDEEVALSRLLTNPDRNELTIPLPSTGESESNDNPLLIEVEFDYNERPRSGSIRTAIPSVSGVNDCRNWVWQLTLPPSEHLISSDDSLILAQPWTWKGWFLSRNPNVESILGNWSGAKNLVSTSGGNQYVFRSLIPRETVRVRTASRRTLVAVASGTALAFGLMLIYLSEMRQPIVLFLAAITLATFGLLFPGPAVMLAQASVVGVGLALVGQWTALLIRRLSISRQLLQIPVQKKRDSSSRLQQSWSDGNSQAATASMPLAENEVVAADSNR